MRMLRAQEDINTFSTPTLLSESDGSYQRGVTLCGVWCRQAWRHALFFVRGNVMILDAITIFLRRILNQKHAINKYAKMGSDGFVWEKKICFKCFFFLRTRTLLVWKEFLKVRGKSKPFLGLSRSQHCLKGKGPLIWELQFLWGRSLAFVYHPVSCWWTFASGLVLSNATI